MPFGRSRLSFSSKREPPVEEKEEGKENPPPDGGEQPPAGKTGKESKPRISRLLSRLSSAGSSSEAKERRPTIGAEDPSDGAPSFINPQQPQERADSLDAPEEDVRRADSVQDAPAEADSGETESPTAEDPLSEERPPQTETTISPSPGDVPPESASAEGDASSSQQTKKKKKKSAEHRHRSKTATYPASAEEQPVERPHSAEIPPWLHEPSKADDVAEPAVRLSSSESSAFFQGVSGPRGWRLTSQLSAVCFSVTTDCAAAGEFEAALQRRGCAVYVRIRPESVVEAREGGPVCLEVGEQTAAGGKQELLVRCGGGKETLLRSFAFTRIFDEMASQAEVYDGTCRHLLLGLFKGISGSVVAYGQTGAGKTYTMTGALGSPPASSSVSLAGVSEDTRLSAEFSRGWGGRAGQTPLQGSARRRNPSEPPLRSSFGERSSSLPRATVGTSLWQGVSAGPSASLYSPRQSVAAGRESGVFGELDGEKLLRRHSLQVTDTRGLIPRCLEELFDLIAAVQAKDSGDSVEGRSNSNCSLSTGDLEITVTASLVEIYNERIRDLLNPKKGPLTIREGPSGETLVADATTVELSNYAHAMEVVRKGLVGRASDRTGANSSSSRSHALCILRLKQQRRSAGWLQIAQLSLVDLAGSERVSVSKVEGKTMRETQAINKSLLALGNVITALAQQQVARTCVQQNPNAASSQSQGGGAPQPRRHVPYRESVLTRLLRQSFGGNAFAVVLVCCSPCSRHLQETLSALRFGDRASRLVNRPAPRQCVSVPALQQLLQQSGEALRMYRACLRSLRVAVGQQQQAIELLQMLIPRDVQISAQDAALLQQAQLAAREAILADAAAQTKVKGRGGGVPQRQQNFRDAGGSAVFLGGSIAPRQLSRESLFCNALYAAGPPAGKTTETAAASRRRESSCPPLALSAPPHATQPHHKRKSKSHGTKAHHVSLNANAQTPPPSTAARKRSTGETTERKRHERKEKRSSRVADKHRTKEKDKPADQPQPADQTKDKPADQPQPADQTKDKPATETATGEEEAAFKGQPQEPQTSADYWLPQAQQKQDQI